jgi:hypothetical protein
MPDALKQRILAGIVTELQSVTNAVSAPLFKTVARYWPVRQNFKPDTECPAAFVVRIKEARPRVRTRFGESDLETDDLQIREMTVGILCIGAKRSPADLETELCDIEARVENKLEHNNLGDLSFPLTWLGTDTPQSSQSVPIGAVMVLFSCQYAHARGDTFDLS